MSVNLAAYAPWVVVGLAGTGAMLVVLNDYRLLAATLGAQYVLAGWLVAQSLGVSVGGAQIFGGWLATIIVFLTWRNSDRRPGRPRKGDDLMSLPSFRLIAVLLVLFASWGLGRRAWMGLPGLTASATLGATFLILLGLLQTSLYRAPMRVVLGLLTVLSGFGIAYGAVESSLAVIALLVAVNLGLALAGSYLTIIDEADAGSRGDT